MSGKGINQHEQIESLKTQVNLLGDQVKELEILLEEAGRSGNSSSKGNSRGGFPG